MKDQFRLTENEIERKKGMLHLHAEGVLVHPVVNGKLRILSVFSCREKQRRFPMEADCITQNGTLFFSVRENISLPDIFYHFTEEVAVHTEEVTL